jgi:hypothetical protein
VIVVARAALLIGRVMARTETDGRRPAVAAVAAAGKAVTVSRRA